MRKSLPMIIEEGGIVSRQKDHQYKENMVRKNSGHHKFGVGDTVLIKQTKRNKLTPAYFPERMKVIEIKGSSLVVSDGHKTVMRDASFFKKVAEAGDDEEDDALEEEEMIPEGNNELPQPDAEESAARSPNATLDQGPNEEAPQEDDVPQESTTSSNRPRRENRRMPERYHDGASSRKRERCSNVNSNFLVFLCQRHYWSRHYDISRFGFNKHFSGCRPIFGNIL